MLYVFPTSSSFQNNALVAIDRDRANFEQNPSISTWNFEKGTALN